MQLSPAHRMARINYAPRALSFSFAFLVLGLLFVERHFSPWVLVFGALQFVVYPHLAYLHTRLATDSKQAELNNLLVDAFLLGGWCAQLSFALWPSFGLVVATCLNSAVSGGRRRLALNVLCLIAGAIVWGGFTGYPMALETGFAVSMACLLGLIAYVSSIGMIVFRQKERLQDAREALRASEEQFRFITEHAGDLVAMLDTEARWQYFSPSFATHFDTGHLRLGGDALTLVHAEDRATVRAALHRMIETAEGETLHFRLNGRNGEARLVVCESNPVCDVPGRITRVIMIARDLTANAKVEIDLRLAAHVFDSLVDGVLISEEGGRIEYVNQAFSRITGHVPSEVIGKFTNDLKSGLQPEQFYEDIWRSIAVNGSWQGRSWERRSNGTAFPAWLSVSAVRDAQGVTSHYVWIIRAATPDYRVKTA